MNIYNITCSEIKKIKLRFKMKHPIVLQSRASYKIDFIINFISKKHIQSEGNNLLYI